MNETLMLPLALAATAGCALGTLFFGGLWWTVRKAVSSQRPSLWLLGSLLLRTSTTLAGFYLVGSGHWQRLLACCLGFVLARFIFVRLTAAPVPSPRISGKEVDHASQS